MAEPEKKQSFWSTMPGILTGVAAVLTAVTGLWLAIAPHEHAGGGAEHASGAVPPVQCATPPASMAQNTSSAQTANQGSVVVTSRAGEVTRLSRRTFVHNFTDKSIELTSGQTIAFEKIKTMDFLAEHSELDMVDVKVTLTDGRTVDGDLRRNYAFTGESDLGPFRILVQDVKQIAF